MCSSPSSSFDNNCALAAIFADLIKRIGITDGFDEMATVWTKIIEKLGCGHDYGVLPFLATKAVDVLVAKLSRRAGRAVAAYSLLSLSVEEVEETGFIYIFQLCEASEEELRRQFADLGDFNEVCSILREMGLDYGMVFSPEIKARLPVP
jgi:hypothetical protein